MKKVTKIFSVVMSVILLLNMELSVLAGGVDGTEVTAESVELHIYDEEDFIEFAHNCTLDDYSQDLIVYLESDLDLTDMLFTDIPIFLGTFYGGNYTITGLNEDLTKDYQGLFRFIEASATVQDLNVEYNRTTDHSFIGGIAAINYGTIENCSYDGVLNGTNTVAGICAENYGFIIDCQTYGGVFGETQIAGITGNNSGTVINCINYADVNTDISDVEFAISTSFLSEYTINDDEVEILDVGGIVGNNTGIISESINYGEVGYPHVGYNIGGIVGMQSGYITTCENYGEVYGRKEVGGIAGQFEPYVSTEYSISKLETLQEEMNTLSLLTTNFSENTQESTNVISSDITLLTSSVEVSKTYADELLEQTEGLLNENIDTVNTISVTVSETIADLATIMESLEPVGTDIDNIIEDLTDEIGEAAQVKEYLLIAQEEFEHASNVSRTDVTAVEMIANLEEINNYIVDGVTALNSASDILKTDMNSSEDIENLRGNIETLTENIENSYDLIQDLSTDLSENEEVTFTKVDENYNETAELLSDSLSDVIDNVDDINLSLNTGLNTALEDFDAINVQLNVVLGLLIDIIQDVSASTDTDYFTVDDSSYEAIDEITAGKISECLNWGTIEGDINIGGIAGAISFEYSFDMEDDYKDVTQTSSNSGFAVIVDCENEGDITAKTDCAGGIVGLQEFGIVFRSSSVADIQSTSGSYIGGIVGSSTALIDSCYSKSNLSGTQYIGGIVGAGVSVKNSYALSSIIGTDGNIGGIAGDLTSDGVMESNFFVGDIIGGLNGISYVGKAEACSYEELILLGNTEDVFGDVFEDFLVEFYVDDVKIDEITVEYNGSIDENQLEAIPEKEGYYGVWEEFEIDCITADIKVDANYIPLVTTLASEEKEEGISLILVEGAYETEYLSIQSNQNTEALYEYTVEVVGENTEIDKVMYLMEADNTYIEVLENDTWKKVSATFEGKYLTFEVDEDASMPVTFRVIEKELPILQVVIIVGSIMLIIALVVVYKKKCQG